MMNGQEPPVNDKSYDDDNAAKQQLSARGEQIALSKTMTMNSFEYSPSYDENGFSMEDSRIHPQNNNSQQEDFRYEHVNNNDSIEFESNNNRNADSTRQKQHVEFEEFLPNNNPSASFTTLDAKLDPFEPREGKTLVWTKINMTLRAPKKKKKRRAKSDETGGDIKLLTDVWGEVPAHKTTAIMGSSGAGKSSLLNILSGRQKSRGRLRIEADVRLNNYKVDPTDINVRKSIAFVAQDDSLPAMITPREIIRFSARLRLPRSMTDEQINKLVDRMIDELGLTSCANTIVGGELIKGISGGERKRTSVGVELVVKPAMVFLDEPTSGLDSFNALRLCNVLKKVANAGSSVLFTIHQPASDIFTSFDNVILLNKGRIMYQGPVRQVPVYFFDRGHPVPRHFNPADWIVHVAQSISINQLDEDGFFPEDDRDLPEPFDNQGGKNDSKHDELGNTVQSRDNTFDGGDERQVGVLVQTKMLLQREFTSLRRDSVAIKSRLALSIVLSVSVGLVFWQVGQSDYTLPANLQSGFGAIMISVMNNITATLLPGIMAIPMNRPVFLREYSTNHYSVFAYLASNLTIDLWVTLVQVLMSCLITYYMVGFNLSFAIYVGANFAMTMAGMSVCAMIGSLVEDPKIAIEMVPITFFPQILFSGFFVTPALIPAWLRWIRNIFPMTYAVYILAINEVEYQCDEFLGMNLCNNLIVDLEACGDDMWWYWLLIVVIFFVLRITALFILRYNAMHFGL